MKIVKPDWPRVLGTVIICGILAVVFGLTQALFAFIEYLGPWAEWAFLVALVGGVVMMIYRGIKVG